MTESGTKDLDLEGAVAALVAMISEPSVASSSIAALLDGLGATLRPDVVRRLGPREQRALYDKSEGFAELHLIDLVPPNRADLEEVRHLGRNTLPLFRIFEKRLCRLPGSASEAPGTLAGYNFQTMSPITGPGYFLAVEDTKRGEVLVDYRKLPNQKPVDWPEIRSNEKGLARFVYGFMVDRLRWVSEHVTIGSAARNDRELGSYFILCRSD
jgi:hypothetical protein